MVDRASDYEHSPYQIETKENADAGEKTVATGLTGESLAIWSLQGAGGARTAWNRQDLRTGEAGGSEFLPYLALAEFGPAERGDEGRGDGPIVRPGREAQDRSPETYEAREARRVADFSSAFEKAAPLERSALVAGALPSQMRAEVQPGVVKLQANDFARLAEAIPGVTLDKTMRTLLEGVKSVGVDGTRLKVEGQAKVPIEMGEGKPTADLNLDNPTFDIVPDAHNPRRIVLENIRGMSFSALGLDRDVKKIALTITDDGKLQVDLTHAASEAQPDKADPLARFRRTLNRAADGLIPETVSKTIALESKESAAQLQTALAGVRDWVQNPEGREPALLLEALAGLDVKTALGGIFDGIKSVEKDGDRLQITRNGKSSHELGGLPIEIAEVVQARIDANPNSPKVEVSGVDFQLPIPDEVARAVGLETPVKGSLKEISFSEKDRDGNRTLTVKTDSLLESVKIKVGPDMQPVPVDRSGNIAIDLVVKRGASLPLTVTFNPAQLEKPPANGPDFTIKLGGKDGDYLKVVESLTGQTLESPLKELVSGVESISKKGDHISVARARATSHDLGGVILDASKEVEFKATGDKNGVKVDGIKGVGIRIPLDMPEFVQDFMGVKNPRIKTDLQSIFVGAPDKNGHQKVVVETSHLLRKVGVTLGPDMKPVLDPHGNWHFYGFADNPLSGKQLPFILRFDRNNNLNMSPQELIRLGGQAAWQAADGSVGNRVVYGSTAVITEVGAMALDQKDNFVRGCKVIGRSASKAWDWLTDW